MLGQLDLKEQIDNIRNEEIINIYNKLICGSENHLRAFTRQLKARGVIYKPQYIHLELYNNIINDKHRKCFDLE